MRLIAFALLAVAIVSAQGQSRSVKPEQPDEPIAETSTIPIPIFRSKRSLIFKTFCEPGTHFRYDCNECSCSNDGRMVRCTRKLCPTEIDSNYLGLTDASNDSRMRKRQARSVRPAQADGPIATNFGNESPIPRPKRFLDPKERCVPDSRFLKDCNWCTCSIDGTMALCTLMYCGPSKRD